MAAIRPLQFTSFVSAEFDPNAPVNEDTIKKLIQNINMLRALNPIASVRAVQINIEGVPIPSTTVWNYCDGSEITEPNSPLNGADVQNTPDMQDRFPRGGGSTTTSGNEAGGAATVDLTHTHAIGNNSNPPNRLEEGDERRSARGAHNHDLDNDLSAKDLNPAHIQCAFYLKVN